MIEQQKLDRLDRHLDTRDRPAVWFLRPQNVAWLGDGADVVVDRGSDVGVAAMGYDGETVRAVAPNNEADRMRTEEFPDRVSVATYPWHDTSLLEAVAAESAPDAVVDVPSVPERDAIDVAPLRLPLTSRDRDKLADASRDAAAAVETVGRTIEPTDTERDAAGRLREELWRNDLESPVALVGGAERAPRHRHFAPTDERLGAYALLTVVAERDGLHVAVTRTVAFDAPDWLEDRHRAASRVAATAVAATREQADVDDRTADTDSRTADTDDRAVDTGGRAADVFRAIQDAYEAVGWAGEWERHHQGGAIGFESREWTATPGDETPVESPAPYAWNPTVEGAKSEDTVFVGDDGVDVLTDTGSWPARTYEAADRDFELELPAILHRT